MKIYHFGAEDAPVLLLLPGTCCHWKSNFGAVIPLLADSFRVLCVSYDGFDETEQTEFPTMLEETKKIEAYLKNHCGGHIRAAYGCSLGGSFVGLLVARQKACDNGRCKIYNLDFPDVIALRQQLLPAGEREQNIPCDLKDPAWFDKIGASGGAVFFASGVFYYFLTEQVKALVQRMADAFPGGVLVFDAANRTAVKMIAKTWLRTAKIKDVGAYFAVSDAPKEIGEWDSRLQVSSKGYMLGYNDLKDPSVSGFFRFLARIGDNGMKMRIVKIGFGGKL